MRTAAGSFQGAVEAGVVQAEMPSPAASRNSRAALRLPTSLDGCRASRRIDRIRPRELGAVVVPSVAALPRKRVTPSAVGGLTLDHFIGTMIQRHIQAARPP